MANMDHFVYLLFLFFLLLVVIFFFCCECIYHKHIYANITDALWCLFLLCLLVSLAFFVSHSFTSTSVSYSLVLSRDISLITVLLKDFVHISFFQKCFVHFSVCFCLLFCFCSGFPCIFKVRLWSKFVWKCLFLMQPWNTVWVKGKWRIWL